ncbi:MAG: hypothetical protein QM674_16765 [Burkholderiaceae bacterium]
MVEGTETAQQIEILQGLGCHAMQGYYFAKPMPIERVEAYLSRGSGIDARSPVVASPTPRDAGGADRACSGTGGVLV